MDMDKIQITVSQRDFLQFNFDNCEIRVLNFSGYQLNGFWVFLTTAFIFQRRKIFLFCLGGPAYRPTYDETAPQRLHKYVRSELTFDLEQHLLPRYTVSVRVN